MGGDGSSSEIQEIILPLRNLSEDVHTSNSLYERTRDIVEAVEVPRWLKIELDESSETNG